MGSCSISIVLYASFISYVVFLFFFYFWWLGGKVVCVDSGRGVLDSILV